MTWGSIPGGKGVKTKVHVLRKGQYLKWGVVSKWPHSQWDIKHNQPTNHDFVIVNRLDILSLQCL